MLKQTILSPGYILVNKNGNGKLPLLEYLYNFKLSTISGSDLVASVVAQKFISSPFIKTRNALLLTT